MPKKDLKLNINKEKLADALNLGKLKEKLAKKGVAEQKKDTKTNPVSSETSATKSQTKEEEVISKVRKARTKSVFEKSDSTVHTPKKESAEKPIVKKEPEPFESTDTLTSEAKNREQYTSKTIKESIKTTPAREENKATKRPERPLYGPRTGRLGPTGRHVRDLVKPTKPPHKKPQSSKPAEKPSGTPEIKTKKEHHTTKPTQKKFKDFREVKQTRKHSSDVPTFDGRDKRGLGDRENEKWRKKRKISKPSSKPDQSPDLPSELTIRIPIAIKDLAQEMKLKASELISKLFAHGVIVTMNDFLDDDTTIGLLGDEFNCKITIDTTEEEKLRITEHTIREEVAAADEESKSIRAPVIAFMGHVDHGKTSLIDYIRQSNIASGEAGLITQHIGAFRCKTAVGDLCILDTPGHEAFSAMRARGAEVTDIIVLVIAGDEGLRAQTAEAIKHAKAAGVTVVVAVNKKDKPNFDLENIHRQLSEVELLPEAWGGQIITVPCSAKTGEGVSSLLEMLALQAEILELRAVAKTRARGTVLESEMHKGLGTVATLLVQNGTLKPGDSLVFSQNYGRVKTMRNEWGQNLDEALPSTPVEVTGLSGQPEAGEEFIVVASEKEAKEIATARQLDERKKSTIQARKVSLESLLKHQEDQGKKTLNILIRADTQGSLEAVRTALLNIKSKKAEVNVIFAGIGEVSESDVQLAAASHAIILGFHTQIEAHAESLVKQHDINVRLHNIIYHAVDDIKEIMTKMLDKVAEDKEHGKAEVKALFKSSKFGQICGCQVTEGTINRNHSIRVRRGKEVIYKGPLQSIRRENDDVREVVKGVECGIILSNFNDVHVGDTLEAYEVIYLSQDL